MRGDVLAVGRTAEVLDWGEGRVLKLFYAWSPAHWADQEARVGRIIGALDLPTPTLLDEVTLDGRRGLVYERVSGQNMLEVMLADPASVPALAAQLGALHGDVHRRRAPELGDIKGALRWSIQRADASPAICDAALARLAALPDGDSLLHFDFHPQQVLLTAGGPVILDWMTATQGHPLADVARTTLLFTVGEKPDGSEAEQVAINAQRNALRNLYLEGYFTARPDLAREPLDDWRFAVAVARLEDGIPGEREALLSIIEECL